MSAPRVQFILKKRDLPFYDYQYGDYSTSSGLANSARFVVDALHRYGLETDLVQVVDNNAIDREVTRFKPTHCIIEALWVVPEKFEILRKLHPNVKWIIRLHSEVPFLALEGIAAEWIVGYMRQENVQIAPNSEQTANDLRRLYMAAVDRPITEQQAAQKVIYLPNLYPVGPVDTGFYADSKATIDVGCFGAIRPLKNQLIQAMAAIEYAHRHRKALNFHINGDRIEQKGDPVSKNIVALFAAMPGRFNLVQHPWYDHEKFLSVVKTMDIGLQLSFTETFNIVTADFVNHGVPVVVSPQIFWVSKKFQADQTSILDIVTKMDAALEWKRNHQVDVNHRHLAKYVNIGVGIWADYLTGGFTP
jgi:hypothetical protein